jgi:hypothetical protein
MARRAVNVETGLAAQQVRPGNWERKIIDFPIVYFSSEARVVDAQMAARDGSLYFGPRGTPVPEKVRARKRLVARLIVHILPAAR